MSIESRDGQAFSGNTDPPKIDFYCSRAAPPTLANVPWYREDNPPAIRFLADNSKLSLHGIQIGNPFMRKYRADTCERCYCRNIEKESNNDTSITRGNIIYYFSTVGRISSSKLRKPILSPLLFLSNSFIEQFPFLFSFFFPRYRIEEKGFSLLYPDNYSTIRSITTTMIRD